MLVGLLLWALIVIIIVVVIRGRFRKSREINESIYKPIPSQHRDPTELEVERGIAELLYKDGYIIFGNLIIPSISKSIASTQIDHVVISINGIFCIETKSHRGNIYGRSFSSKWKQYLGPNKYDVHSPIQQNKHHVKSLEHLLRTGLKAPIHSYIIFPNASKVMLDGDKRDMSIGAVISKIRNHTRLVYSLDEIERIAKALAYASSKSESFEDAHITAVKEYLDRATKF